MSATETKPMELPIAEAKPLPPPAVIEDGESRFKLLQRRAKALSESSFVPDTFKGSVPNCIIAVDIADRLRANELAVCQNLYIVHGKPAWSSQFLIACVNSLGRFTPLRYAEFGEGDAAKCTAYATEKATQEVVTGSTVTFEMAKAEGWVSKNGSKWRTMPQLMLRYRAATLFARTYCPEVTFGIVTQEEVIDIEATATPVNVPKL